MKNIHLLPTDEPSRLGGSEYIVNIQGIDKRDFKLKLWNKIISNKDLRDVGYIPQNIYITSDEEIKEGDYFWKPDCNMIFKAEYTPHKGCKKVILTTDQDLIKDGVQSIDDEFLEWFVKNPSCEEVKIESWQTKGEWELDYKIIIPKEEPKQETLEEVAEKVLANNIDGLRDALQDDDLFLFYKGVIQCYGEAMANYQAKRMYSAEDLILFYDFIENHQLRKYGDIWKRITNDPNVKPFNCASVDDKYVIEWFEEFKKK